MFSTSQGINVPPTARGLGMVFQSYALWPHMTVFENVAFGLEQQKVARDETERRVMKALEDMDLAELGGGYPSELSG